MPFRESSPAVLAVTVGPGQLGPLMDDLVAALAEVELCDARSLYVAADAEITIAELLAMQSLGTLASRVQSEWFAELLREGRLETHFQPIVEAGEPGSVFAFECLTRGLDGEGRLIPPGRLYGAARTTELLFQLDRAARLRAIRSAAGQGHK